MKTLIKFLIITLITVTFAFASIELLFQNKKANPFIFPTQKKWLHRVNTPARIAKLSKDIGPGLEIDVYFYPKQSKFYVLHDWIKDPSEELSLENYLFQIKKSNKYLWIDLKNLLAINKKTIARELKVLLDRYQLRSKTLVESQNGWAHITLSRSGLNCSYWLNPHSKSRISWIRNIENKLILIFGNFTSISFSHNKYSSKIQKMFNQFPILLFNIEKPSILKEYEANEGLKVLLMAKSRK